MVRISRPVVKLALAAGCVVGLSTSALGSTVSSVTYWKVALSGESNAGWNGAFATFRPPTISRQSDVAFWAETDADASIDEGIFFGNYLTATLGWSVSKIAQEGDPAPRLPGHIFKGEGFVGPTARSGFGLPLLNHLNGAGTEVAFVGNYDRQDSLGTEGFWLVNHSAGTADLITFAPDDVLTDPVFKNYYLDLGDGGIGDQTLARSLTHVGVSLVGGSSTVVLWYSKLNTGPGQGMPGSEKRGGVWCGTSSTNHMELARQGDVIATGAEVETEAGDDSVFNSGTMSGSGVAAISCESSNNSYHMLFRSDAVPAVLRDLVTKEGDPAPGTSYNFVNLDFAAVINNDANVAFRGQTDDAATSMGIWAEKKTGSGFADHLLENVVYASDPVPSVSGATWLKFGDPVINGRNNKAFVGRFERDEGGTMVTHEGVFRADSANNVSLVARSGTSTPLSPNAPGTTEFVGTFVADFDDPSMNTLTRWYDQAGQLVIQTDGSVVFLAAVDITYQPYIDNLASTGVPVGLIHEEGIFATDSLGALQTVVSVGMTLDNLLGNGDDRVIIDLEFLNSDSTIDEEHPGTPLPPTPPVPTTLEGMGSGYQDGRRTGITEELTKSGSDCRLLRVAFRARLGENGGPTTTEGIFVAELSTCPVGPGSGCETCLCSTDPECMEGSMLLGPGPDFDQDGVVGDSDLKLMMEAQGLMEGRFDMNKDGIVDGGDVGLLTDKWGPVSASEESK